MPSRKEGRRSREMGRVRPRVADGRRAGPSLAVTLFPVTGAAFRLRADPGAARAGTYFDLPPPGAALPSAGACARAVAAHLTRENRPENAAPNRKTWHAGA